MNNESYVVVKKKNTIWKVLGILLAVAALCAAAVIIYQKFFKKKQQELDEVAELDLLDELSEEDLFCADAEAVIADAEEMA